LVLVPPQCTEVLWAGHDRVFNVPLPSFKEEKRVEAASTLFSSKNLLKEVVSSMSI
jgi:hypothetical protein